MVSSLLFASVGENDECIVSYSDIFYGSEVVKALMESTETLGISYDPEWLSLLER